MLDIPLTILTLAAPLSIGCAVRLLAPRSKRGVVLALVLATAIIPARGVLDVLIHRSADAAEVGWGFAVVYGLVTGMIGLVLAELIISRRERRAREALWEQEPVAGESPVAEAVRAPEVRYRDAVPADIPALVALVESAYRGESSRVGWTTEADLLGGQRTDAEDIAALLGDAAARILLAVEAEDVVGCVLLRREPGGAYLGMLAVKPALQTRGLGKALLAEAEGRARGELGAARVRMTVIEQRTELIAWYERRGYRRTGATEAFPYGNPRFGLPKRPDLRFVVLEKPV